MPADYVPLNFFLLELQNVLTLRTSELLTLLTSKPLIFPLHMKVNNFEDLRIWQMANELCLKIYGITKIGEFKYDTRFVQQIRSSSGSIMDNIAEGFERQGNKEFKNFLYIAKGSAGETRSQIIRAHKVGFIDNETYSELYNDCIRLSSSINSFIQSLKNTEYKGTRYNEVTS